MKIIEALNEEMRNALKEVEEKTKIKLEEIKKSPESKESQEKQTNR